MLNWLCHTWLARFHAHDFMKQYSQTLEAEVLPIDIASVPSLKLPEWQLAAIDFHCRCLFKMARLIGK